VSSILVTGTGGGVGQSIIKSLQGTPYTVIAADGEPLGTGLYAACRSYRIPYASAPDYVDRLLAICRAEGVRLVFPGLDVELPPLAAAAPQFQDAGVTVVVSRPEVVDLCDDKLATAAFLARHGFPAPRTARLTDDVARSVSFPMVLKPLRGGARSLGVFVVRSPEELAHRRNDLDPARYVAQELMEGSEYTCGTVTFDGRCFGAIVMRRTLRDGDTYKAFVDRDPELAAFVTRVVEALGPFGPCNVQMRVRDGTPYVFEFNSRCSGTTACRTLAGFNEPLMVADYLLAGRTPSYTIRDLVFLRYWKELVVDPRHVDQMTRDGFLEAEGSPL
jgi:carbamoyl-phosphate synthase large subunit